MLLSSFFLIDEEIVVIHKDNTFTALVSACGNVWSLDNLFVFSGSFLVKLANPIDGGTLNSSWLCFDLSEIVGGGKGQRVLDHSYTLISWESHEGAIESSQSEKTAGTPLRRES